MKRRSWVLFFILLIQLYGRAQQPEEALNRLSGRSPIEKIYLHYDKDNYLAGETIWFKVYMYSDYFPDTISSTLYVELLNESSTVISRKIIPVFLGNSNGQIELPDSLESGSYFIRAYSPTMLNQDPDFIYRKKILVYGKRGKDAGAIVPREKILRFEFFPEGGNLVTGLVNTIAFKATNENGLPVNVSGSIKNERDETLATFSSYHDGMGMFDLLPKPNEKYYAIASDDTTAHKYFLPASVDHGIVFRIMPDPRGKYFQIQQFASDSIFQAAYMIGQMQHQIVFKQSISSGKDQITGVIDVSHLNSGILQVTVFNKQNLPLAERITFIDNKEYIQPAELIEDTIQFSEKAKNRFTISFKDTVTGSFSISVSDPAYSLFPLREENIFSRFLLTSDLKGYIHNPAWYFSNNKDSSEDGLDLVMMTNGWRRFTWNSLLKDTLRRNVYKDPSYITLSGTVHIRDTKRPFAEKPILIFIAGEDSTKSIQLITTNQEGNFKLDSLLFFGPARIFFSDVRGKKSQFIDVKLSGDSLTRTFSLPTSDSRFFTSDNSWLANSQSKFGYDYDAIARANGLMLQGVVVRGYKKKSAVQELEEKYASGLFSGFSERTIDLVHTNEPIYQNNIFDYLQSRVAGLSISHDGPEYTIIYRQGGSVSSRGPVPMTLFLDEIQTDANMISSIPANQIAMVKIFSSFVGAVGNGAGGVLAIYTKKGEDLYNSMPSSGDQLPYRGYSVIKEFYSPDYAVDTAELAKPDHRITLQWLPQLMVDGVNTRVPVIFYNNDRSRQFKIVVEGMTYSGKMVSIEKIISSETLKRSF